MSVRKQTIGTNRDECSASKAAGFVDAVSDECYNQFKRERGGTQRRGDVTVDLLWIHCMLVT